MANPQVSNNNLELRKLAAITLEKNVQSHWLNVETEKTPHFSKVDQANMRKSFVSSMLECGDMGLIKLLSSALNHVLRKDWPTEWPEFEKDIIAQIKASPSAENLYPLLCAYNAFTKTRQYNHGDDRDEISEANYQLMPTLEKYMDEILSGNSIANEIQATLAKKIFNIMYKHTRIDLDKYFRTKENNDKWMNYISKVLLDMEGDFYTIKVEGKVEENKMDKNPFWGVKKSAFSCIKKYTFRYGIPEDESKENEDFATYWATSWGKVFAEVSVKYIKNKSQGSFVPLSILSESCGFLARSIKAK